MAAAQAPPAAAEAKQRGRLSTRRPSTSSPRGGERARQRRRRGDASAAGEGHRHNPSASGHERVSAGYPHRLCLWRRGGCRTQQDDSNRRRRPSISLRSPALCGKWVGESASNESTCCSPSAPSLAGCFAADNPHWSREGLPPLRQLLASPKAALRRWRSSLTCTQL